MINIGDTVRCIDHNNTAYGLEGVVQESHIVHPSGEPAYYYLILTTTGNETIAVGTLTSWYSGQVEAI